MNGVAASSILGGSCARVCPTEILCEDSCVGNHDAEGQPVKIGLLQRYAVDAVMEQPVTALFKRARSEDIPVLTDFLIKKYSEVFSRKIPGVAPTTRPVFEVWADPSGCY